MILLVLVCVSVCNAPITHTPYWAVSSHIGDTGEHGETWEGIGNDTGRSGEKRGEMGRNGEIRPHRTGPYWKNTGRSGRRGSNMGDTGITRELYGSNTSQSSITLGNTGEHFRPHSHVVEPGLWIFLPQEASCPSVRRGVSCRHDSMASPTSVSVQAVDIFSSF